MTESEMAVAAKVGGSAALGSVIALRFLPGTWWQRMLSFVSSLGIGCLAGGAAVERFLLVPGSYTHMLAVASPPCLAWPSSTTPCSRSRKS